MSTNIRASTSGDSNTKNKLTNTAKHPRSSAGEREHTTPSSGTKKRKVIGGIRWKGEGQKRSTCMDNYNNAYKILQTQYTRIRTSRWKHQSNELHMS